MWSSSVPQRAGRLVPVAVFVAFVLLIAVACRPDVPPPTSPTDAVAIPSSTVSAAPTASATRASSAFERPNVVLITIDTLRADHLSSYGYFRNTTPTIDTLAREGVRFDMDITQFAQTNPSHASILTGTYPAVHKVMVHGVDKVDPKVTTLAEAMRDLGYATAGFYSWPSLDPQMSGLDRGFSTYRGIYQPYPGHEADPDIWRRSEGRADRTTAEVLNWVEANKALPFFLWVHYQDPHYPYNTPVPFRREYESHCDDCLDADWNTIDLINSGARLSDRDIAHLVALYDGAIAFTDQEIGRLVDRLRGLSLLDRTLVLVTADHGESFGENGRWFHPFVPFNSVLRVPLVLRYPPALPAGLVVDSLVRSIDIAPSILELARGSIPPEVEGRSLLPVIAGTESGGRVAVTQAPDDLVTVLTTDEWKLIRKNSENLRELYYLKGDPGELRDLAASEPKQLDEMEHQLKEWMDGHGIRPQN